MGGVLGRPLLARIGEDRVGLSFGRGVAILRAIARRHGFAPRSPPLLDAFFGAHRLVERLSAGVTEDSLGDLEPDFVRFADFARASASLWRLRHQGSFLPVVRRLLERDDPEYAHDEYVLFLASQLLAAGLRPEAPRHSSATTLDLAIPGAFVRGGRALFIEAKERNPIAERTPAALAKYIVGKLAESRGQLNEARVRGIAAIDLGLVDPASTPVEGATLAKVRQSLASGPLVGVLLSDTAALYDERRSAFTPSFRSWLYLSRRVLTHRAEPLRRGVLARLRTTFPYGSLV